MAHLENATKAIENAEKHLNYLVQQLAEADRTNVIAAADDVLKLVKVIAVLKEI